MVADVGNPIVAADVVEAEDVEAVESEPDVAEHLAAAQVLVLVVDEPVVHADVETPIGWCTEGVALQTCMWRAEGKSVGNGGLEVHLPARSAREVVGEEEVDVVALVGRLRNVLSVELHASFHQREAHP